MVLNAKLLGIPVIIHEQTAAYGRSNHLCAGFASKIALSRVGSKKYYPAGKCVVTGNPVMKEITKIKPKLRLGSPPVIFITGGSRGSQKINDTLSEILNKLLSKYKLIHQTGGLDYLKFSEIKQRLPQALRDNYEVFVRVNPLEVSKIYEESNIVVARAGANTVSEVMTIKRPAIFIPLPISFMDEQMKNAVVARDLGLAKIILQKDLTPEILLKYIEELVGNYQTIVEKVKLRQTPDMNASKKLLTVIKDYVK